MKIIDAFREFFRTPRIDSVMRIYDNEGELIYCSSEDASQQRLRIASLLDRRDANDCPSVYPQVMCIYDSHGELIYCSSEDAPQQRLRIASLLERQDANVVRSV